VAATGEEALRLLKRTRPDVVSLDIQLPGIDGLRVAERIMAENPTPIVVVAGSGASGAQTLSMRALASGALSVVEKPRTSSHEEYEVLSSRICTQLAIMSQVRVVRQRFRHGSPEDAGAKTAARAPLTRPSGGCPKVLAVAASTGGPPALVKLFGGLGADFPLPILLVQHVTPAFTRGFASWLSGVVPFAVETVAASSVLRPGVVYLADADRHLRATALAAWASKDEPVDGQRPSGSVLFRSVAEAFGERALGVILTGMGEDGADGLLALRRAGAFTVAEHESTTVVHGMPAAAERLQAVCESLPLHDIAPRLKELTLASYADV
jgi:two-component system chemotaxis response regulator CheB